MNITITISLLEDSEGVVLSDVATLTAHNGCLHMAFTNPVRNVTVSLKELKYAMQMLMSQGE